MKFQLRRHHRQVLIENCVKDLVYSVEQLVMGLPLYWVRVLKIRKKKRMTRTLKRQAWSQIIPAKQLSLTVMAPAFLQWNRNGNLTPQQPRHFHV